MSAKSAEQLADHRCHTCRRRRLVCDRQLPRCCKCQKAGVECLGYGRLVLWNKGVASRGKMMGRTFVSPGPSSSLSSPGADTSDTNRDSTNGISTNRSTPVLRPPPVDAIFQDLDGKTRFYLRHFAAHVSRDFVQRDVPGWNTARSLVQLATAHPALLHVAVATSAHHLFNVAAATDASSAAAREWPACSIDRAALLVATRTDTFLEDAVGAEDRGYRLLRATLSQPDPDLNVVLACMLLFVTAELIQSGKGAWRAHIDAATRLLKQLDSGNGLTTLGNEPSSSSEPASLRQWLASELVVYIVLASTTSPVSTSPDLPQSHAWLDAVLLRAEENNYLSCPATLMRVLLAVSKLRVTRLGASMSSVGARQDDTGTEATALLHVVDSFDPAVWAVEIERRTLFADFQPRMHVASAHKIAVRLYLCRALPDAPASAAAATTLQHRADLVTACVRHVSCVELSDPLFKSTSWSAFIAGAESNDEDERAWVLQRLTQAWRSMPWGYVRSEIEMLGNIWRHKSELGVLDYDWTQLVQHSGDDLLLV